MNRTADGVAVICPVVSPGRGWLDFLSAGLDPTAEFSFLLGKCGEPRIAAGQVVVPLCNGAARCRVAIHRIACSIYGFELIVRGDAIASLAPAFVPLDVINMRRSATLNKLATDQPFFLGCRDVWWDELDEKAPTDWATFGLPLDIGEQAKSIVARLRPTARTGHPRPMQPSASIGSSPRDDAGARARPTAPAPKTASPARQPAKRAAPPPPAEPPPAPGGQKSLF